MSHSSAGPVSPWKWFFSWPFFRAGCCTCDIVHTNTNDLASNPFRQSLCLSKHVIGLTNWIGIVSIAVVVTRWCVEWCVQFKKARNIAYWTTPNGPHSKKSHRSHTSSTAMASRLVDGDLSALSQGMMFFQISWIVYFWFRKDFCFAAFLPMTEVVCVIRFVEEEVRNRCGYHSENPQERPYSAHERSEISLLRIVQTSQQWPVQHTETGFLWSGTFYYFFFVRSTDCVVFCFSKFCWCDVDVFM
jgi:hypothetical protein